MVDLEVSAGHELAEDRVPETALGQDVSSERVKEMDYHATSFRVCLGSVLHSNAGYFGVRQGIVVLRNDTANGLVRQALALPNHHS